MGAHRTARMVPVLAVALAWGALAAAGTPKDETGALHWEVRVSYVASLVHVIDNLSGASPGKTVDAYRRSWLRLVGPLTPEERTLLAGWRRAMLRDDGTPQRIRRLETDAACAPPPSRRLSRRQRLEVAALHAETADGFVAAASELLTAEERAALRTALRHFEPGFRKLWERMGYLEPFAGKLRRFLSEPKARAMTASLVAFYGGPETSDPVRIHLVGLLGEQFGTHAEAFGDDLLLEIRPHDRPRGQVQVIYHELSHDLFHRLPGTMRAAWASWFLEQGPPGALAWGLLHEALPTALGQGVAESRLARSLWSRRDRWYHLPDVDRYAHAIFPLVHAAIRRGATMDRALAHRLVAVLDPQMLARTPVLAFFVDGAFAAPPELARARDALARRVPSRDAVLVDLGPGDGLRFLERFDCVPLLALLDSRASALLHAVEPAAPARRKPSAGETPVAGRIVPGRRASGAAALWILVEDEEAAERTLEVLAGLPGWPSETIVVPGVPSTAGPRP